MYQINYMHEFTKKTKPKLPFRYALEEEGRYLMEIDRAEKMKEKAHERRLEENDKKKIVAVLEKEKRDEKVTKARHQQLTQMAEELRELHHYLNMAKNTQALVAQLKLQDIEIDRRVEMAKKASEEVQAKCQAFEERTRQAELAGRQKAKELGIELKAQMEENDARRMELKKIRTREGNEMKKQVEKLNEKYRQELQAAYIAKQKLRKDTIEFLRQKIEFKKQQKVDETNLVLQHYEMERKRDAMQQAIEDARKERIRHRLCIGTQIGEKVWAINNAKEQSFNNLVDTFAMEHQNRCDLLHEQEQEKAIENRRIMQDNMKMQMVEKQAKKTQEHMRTMELMHRRLTQSHHDSEMNLLRKRMERERWENERYLQARAFERAETEREEREAEKTGICSYVANELREKQEIETVRIKTLQEQPISTLRYLPTSFLRSNYLPQPIKELVKEQIRRDPIPVFNVKRNQYYVKRMKDVGGDLVMCSKTCPTSRSISNIF